jgi:hypothetical protein
MASQVLHRVVGDSPHASDCGGVAAIANQECPSTLARDIPDEPEPRPSDRELQVYFVAVRVDGIPYLGHQNGEDSRHQW